MALSLTTRVISQEPKSSAIGKCNAVATGSNITVKVDCSSSVSKEQAAELARQYHDILHKIQQENLSFTAVNQKLDSIQKGVDDLRSTNAPRHLLAGQITRLRNMEAASETGVGFLLLGLDQESMSYAVDFGNALQPPDSVVQKWGSVMPPIIGITVYMSSAYRSREELTGSCKILLNFLDEEKIPYQLSHGQEFADPSDTSKKLPCVLSTGAKPLQ